VAGEEMAKSQLGLETKGDSKRGATTPVRPPPQTWLPSSADSSSAAFLTGEARIMLLLELLKTWKNRMTTCRRFHNFAGAVSAKVTACFCSVCSC
jgi:hypothetical protein